MPDPSTSSSKDDGPIDLSGLIDSFSTAKDAILQGVNNIVGAVSQGKKAYAGEQQAIQRGGEAAASVSDIDQAAALKAKMDTANVTAQLGTNPDASTFILGQLGQKNIELQKDVQARYEDIGKRQDVAPWDDPIQFLFNRLVLPYKQEALKTKQDQLQEQMGFTKGVQEQTTQAAANMNAIDTAASSQLLAAKHQQILAETELRANNAMADAAKFTISAVSPMLAANSEQFDLLYKLNTAQVQNRDLQLAEGRFGLEKTQKELYDFNKQLQIEARQDDLNAKAAITTKLGNVAAVTGTNALSYPEFEKLSAPARMQLEKLMSDPNFDKGRLGFTPAEALSVANEFEFPLTPGANIVRKALVGIEQGVISQNSATWKSFPQDVRNNLVNGAIQDTANKEIKNIPAEGGIYSPPPLNSILSIPSLQKLPLSAALAPLANNKQYAMKADDIMSEAFKMVKKPEDIPAVAAQVSQLYKGVIQANQSTKQYSLFALPELSEQSGFHTMVHTNYGWKGFETMDMTNQAAVTAALTRQWMAKDNQQDYLQLRLMDQR